jgi:hypothetical protein
MWNISNICGRKAFRVCHGKWLTAEEGSLFAEDHCHDRGIFFIEPVTGDEVQIRTSHGKYLAAGEFHNLYLTHQQQPYETRFHVEFNYDGRVSFKSHHKGWLGIDQNGEVHVIPQKGENELFEVHAK